MLAECLKASTKKVCLSRDEEENVATCGSISDLALKRRNGDLSPLQSMARLHAFNWCFEISYDTPSSFAWSVQIQRNKKESEIVVLGHFESIANFKDMKPFSVVEGNGFREMFRSIDDSIEIPSRKYLFESQRKGKIIINIFSHLTQCAFFWRGSGNRCHGGSRLSRLRWERCYEMQQPLIQLSIDTIWLTVCDWEADTFGYDSKSTHQADPRFSHTHSASLQNDKIS